MLTSGSTDTVVRWGHTALTLVVTAADDAPPALARLDSTPFDGVDGVEPVPVGTQPLVELLVAGEGSTWSGTRSVGSAVGSRLRYVAHRETSDEHWRHLTITSRDPATDVTVETTFSTVDGLSVVRVVTAVRADGDRPATVQSVTSFVSAVQLASGESVDDLDLYWARNDWLAESKWQNRPVRELGLVDIDLGLHGADPRGCFAAISHGSWSSGELLPSGVLVARVSGRAWMWQVEHNGAWRWEVGESRGGPYLAAGGPTDADHQWQHVLEPGDEFRSVPVSISVSDAGLEGAVAAMTSYRRAILRPHPARATLPVVFNDYMNTLMGDPTTARLLPLIEAAAEVGAEYFCIDAGWYGDGYWWDTVGAWEPSSSRFPGGLDEVIDRIRQAGMVPGLWLEPEVVGVRSPVAAQLPDEAFFQRGGRRQIEHGRYHLDLRHPSAVAHVSAVVDRLVGELGVGYFKLDYNINPGAGTEVKAAAPGDGLLGHNRAYLGWLDDVLDRYPDLVIENCSSGAMRMDYALLSRLHLQSTSDQRNPLLYAPIAAAAPMSVLPEQAGNWAYPQPEMSLEQIAFTLVTGLSGRPYLSGHINRMSRDQLRLVREAVTAYRRIRPVLADSVPFWPLGLPAWRDPWVATGLRGTNATTDTYLAVWWRGSGTDRVALPVPHLQGKDVTPDAVFPTELPRWDLTWDAELGVLTATPDGHGPAARLLRLTAG